MGNGRITFLLRPQQNEEGDYHMGVSNMPATVDLEQVVFFAYPQQDGSLLLTMEKYDERRRAGNKKTR